VRKVQSFLTLRVSGIRFQATGLCADRAGYQQATCGTFKFQKSENCCGYENTIVGYV
jgi:hypothetical protein